MKEIVNDDTKVLFIFLKCFSELVFIGETGTICHFLIKGRLQEEQISTAVSKSEVLFRDINFEMS